MRYRSPLLLLGMLLAAPVRSAAQGPLVPPETGGAVAAEHARRMLGHHARVLVVGAHPDDEDTELLTVLVRGMGVEAAYLSLTRGEGGQNLIGPELGEALGLLRTEELLAARRLDGARQYFTRAYDFGYSRTLDDTWAHWPRDSVLADVVRIVRRFRPHVVVSIFSGTPQDGHGQHQAAGWAAAEAFRAAGDSTRFPGLAREGLAPWTPLKLFRSTRFDSSATTLTLDGGALDPAVGRTYHQIAMQGRSLHRSQDMGRLQRIGPSLVLLALIEDRAGRGGLFDGVDTTLVPLLGAARARQFAAALAALDSASSDAAADRALAAATAALGTASGPDSLALADQARHLARLAAARRGLLLDATADDAAVTAGQPLAVETPVWAPGRPGIRGRAALAPEGAWSGRPAEPGPAGFRFTAVAGDTVTTPYFLREPRRGDLYVWPADAMASWGEPFQPPPLGVAVTPLLDGAPLAPPLRREVTFRYNDQAFGERREPLRVVPRVDLRLEPETGVWPAGDSRPRVFTVTLRHGGRDSLAGQVRLALPAGWAAPPARPFRFGAEDESVTLEFTVRPPAGVEPGRHAVVAVAEAGGRRWTTGVRTVAYPHIRPRFVERPARAGITVAPIALPALDRVAYVRGAADRVPEALRQVGVPLQLLDPAALARADLSRYDAVIIGPRAYEVEPALAAANPRLLEYARRGGLVIVQYQQYGFFSGGYAPYPLAVAGRLPGGAAATLVQGGTGSVGLMSGHDRVTDETAPVRVVDSTTPVLAVPNRIGPADWEGWVQERGLYFARDWDPAYRPILAMHDPGEPPLYGSLLVASVGQGTWVYTGLSFFRQLPAGVPGAYRLFANLLALGGR